MNEEEIIQMIEYTLKDKLQKDENYIKYTFYEIRLKYDLSEIETKLFLHLIKNKLENMNYEVFYTGSEYEYMNQHKVVEDNEILIAIKNQSKTKGKKNTKEKKFEKKHKK